LGCISHARVPSSTNLMELYPAGRALSTVHLHLPFFCQTILHDSLGPHSNYQKRYTYLPSAPYVPASASLGIPSLDPSPSARTSHGPAVPVGWRARPKRLGFPANRQSSGTGCHWFHRFCAGLSNMFDLLKISSRLQLGTRALLYVQITLATAFVRRAGSQNGGKESGIRSVTLEGTFTGR
jgi:hypothetical protein